MECNNQSAGRIFTAPFRCKNIQRLPDSAALIFALRFNEGLFGVLVQIFDYMVLAKNPPFLKGTVLEASSEKIRGIL
ncbi:MAG: hypothetical protein ACE5HO_14950 [bacterium]